MLEKPVESFALQILQGLSHAVHSYTRILAEDQVSQLIREDELRDRLRLLNPAIPLESIEEAVRVIEQAELICRDLVA